jgi:hypothetical protein
MHVEWRSVHLLGCRLVSDNHCCSCPQQPMILLELSISLKNFRIFLFFARYCLTYIQYTYLLAHHRFALMNDKMGGDLEKIKVVGQYLIEVWSAAGMDMSGGKVVFKWASDEITSNASTYVNHLFPHSKSVTLLSVTGPKCSILPGDSMSLESRSAAKSWDVSRATSPRLKFCASRKTCYPCL